MTNNKSYLLFIGLIFWVSIFFSLPSYAQNPKILGQVKSSSITEISGIVPYSYREGYFWVHNDSGDGANIYLIDSLASLKVSVEIDGINAIDIEDIARFSIGKKKYLLIADIGNNLRDREILSMYIIEEPNINLNLSSPIKVPLIKEVKFKYADKRRDAESIFVDPIDQSIYIISKRDFESTVFKLDNYLNNNTVHVLIPILALPFTFATAADISADGKYIVVKNLTSVYLWERQNSQSIIEALKNYPRQIEYFVEPQGEAICFDLNNRFLYTISERPFGLDSYLYKYDF